MRMRMRFRPRAVLRRQVPTILVIGLAALASAGARAADASQGVALAKRWCASCHLVATDQKLASADVPAFAAIAARADFTAEKIAFFLLDPHPPMPNFSLSRSEAADIAAYIGSLRK
jgi:mono/diheme cytochrome c family protein